MLLSLCVIHCHKDTDKEVSELTDRQTDRHDPYSLVSDVTTL